MMEVLGRGGFATVYKAKYLATGEIRAVKQMKKSKLGGQISRKEFEILRQLDHPNIIRVHELFETQDYFYIVSEFCDGGELYSSLLEQRRFNEQKAAIVVSQILQAVAYSHNQKVLHRDIKPENILLHKSGEMQVSLADFGNACFYNRNQQLKGLFGSCYYIAPEMFRDSYNEKVDIWSIGIIMYVILTGRAPYSGRNEKLILSQAEQEPFQPIRSQCFVSDEAFSLLQSLLAINPQQRVNAVQALQHPWFQKVNTHTPYDLTNSLNQIKSFYCQVKLKEAVQIFITTQMLSKEEMQEMKQAFIQFDINGDGYITYQELTTVMRQYSQDWQKEAGDILRRCDADNSGKIEYTEFLKACADWERLMCQKYLVEAFKMFDLDQNGTITAEEIRQTLEEDQQAEDKVWQQIIAEVDQNNDGEINLQEFLDIMSKNFD